jgi:hypothetical protein
MLRVTIIITGFFIVLGVPMEAKCGYFGNPTGIVWLPSLLTLSQLNQLLL